MAWSFSSTGFIGFWIQPIGASLFYVLGPIDYPPLIPQVKQIEIYNRDKSIKRNTIEIKADREIQ